MSANSDKQNEITKKVEPTDINKTKLQIYVNVPYIDFLNKNNIKKNFQFKNNEQHNLERTDNKSQPNDNKDLDLSILKKYEELHFTYFFDDINVKLKSNIYLIECICLNPFTKFIYMFIKEIILHNSMMKSVLNFLEIERVNFDRTSLKRMKLVYEMHFHSEQLIFVIFTVGKFDHKCQKYVDKARKKFQALNKNLDCLLSRFYRKILKK